MNKHVLAATDANFKNMVLESKLPVLVDFWAPWCGPCRIVGPVIEELAGEYAERFLFVKVNCDENGETPSRYGVSGIPTLAIFKNGEVVDGIVGAAPKKMLKELVEKHLQPILVG